MYDGKSRFNRASSTHQPSFHDDLPRRQSLAVFFHAHGTRTGRLGMLTADTESPVVTETAMGTDLLQPLKVVAQLRVDTVREDLQRLAVDDVSLPIQEPDGDLELRRVLHDGDDALEFVRVEVTGAARTKGEHKNRLESSSGYAPLVEVHIGFFADDVGVPPTDTLNFGQSIHDFALSVHIRVEKAEDVLQQTAESTNGEGKKGG
jgi:hypothetical protein